MPSGRQAVPQDMTQEEERARDGERVSQIDLYGRADNGYAAGRGYYRSITERAEGSCYSDDSGR